MSSHVIVSSQNQQHQPYYITSDEMSNFERALERRLGAFLAHQETTDAQLKETRDTLFDLKKKHDIATLKAADDFAFLHKKVKYTLAKLESAIINLDKMITEVTNTGSYQRNLSDKVNLMGDVAGSLGNHDFSINKIINRLCEYDASFVGSKLYLERMGNRLDSTVAEFDAMVKRLEAAEHTGAFESTVKRMEAANQEHAAALESSAKRLEAANQEQAAALESTVKRLEAVEKALKEAEAAKHLEEASKTLAIEIQTETQPFESLAKSRKRRFASLETIAAKKKK